MTPRRQGLGLLMVALAWAAAGCSRDTVGHSPAPSPSNPGDLLVIGNSITRMKPKPDMGWFGWRGMAASSEARDFAHLLAAALRVPLTAVHVGRVEYDAEAPLPSFAVTPSTWVVVALGDNGLAPRYAELLAAVGGGAALVCVSTWWRRTEVDARMKPLCLAAGGHWVDIGDLYRGRLGLHWNEGVDRHPGDAAMAQIADRILRALEAARH